MKRKKIQQKDRTRCEVYSRIVGYIRPIDNWNAGKQAEFKDRQTYDKTVTNICSC